MSKPSFSNIDLWLFELAEGNLTPAQVEQLELFLLQHPELDVERDVWEMAKVSPAVATYPGQDNLRKKRPVAWYAFGSAATVGVIVLGWFMLSGIDGSKQQMASRDFDGSKTRVFVKQNNGAGVAVANSDALNETNEIADVTRVYSEQLQNGIVSNQTPEIVQSIPSPVIAGANRLNSGQQSSRRVSSRAGSVSLTPVFTSSMYNSASTDMVFSMVNQMDRLGAEMLNVAELEERGLATRQAYELDVLEKEDYVLAENSTRRTPRSYGMSSGEYKKSLKSRVNAFSRKLQRMMNNPVALKNFRDPYYHVPGMLPNDLNFSSTGTMLSARVQTLSRLQWYGKENEQLQNQLAIDGYAYGIRGGVGLQVNHTLYNDGGMNVASAAITYSPKLSISRMISIEPSLRFKMGNKSLTKSKMENVSQVEVERGNAHEFYPEGGVIGQQLWYKDLGAGLMVNTEWFFAGVQVDNLFRHKDNIYSQDFEEPRRADYHFVGTIGTDWVSRKENLSLSPYFVYQKSENLSEAWLGANFRWNWFTVGGSISSNMEPAGSLGLKFDHFALSYNADYVESAMTGQRGLSHQLTLRFVSKPSRFGKRLLNL